MGKRTKAKRTIRPERERGQEPVRLLLPVASGDRQHPSDARSSDAEHAPAEISCAGGAGAPVPVVYHVHITGDEKEKRHIRESIQFPDHMCTPGRYVLCR